jgi:cell division septation protein DedD
MSQEQPTANDSQNITKPKKRWMTVVLLLVLVGVGLYAIDKSVEGKFFQAVKNTAVTTIGGGMNDEQKKNVESFSKRLNDLRSQRDAIAKGEVTIPAAAPAEEKPAEEKPADEKPAETPTSDTPPANTPAETKPTDEAGEKKDGT